MIEEQIVLNQICLGKQGEDNTRFVKFTEPIVWFNLYGEGYCELYHKRCGDEEPYKVELEYSDTCIMWKICAKDTAYQGKGQCELRYMVNGAVVKSQTYDTKVVAITDVTTEEEATETIADMVGQILEAKAEIEELVKDLPEDFGGGMNYIGEVATLPSEANEGDVYRITQPIKSGKLSITVSGVQSVEENPDGMDGSLVVYLDENSPLYSFFGCVRELQYGENEDGRTGDSYIEYNGQTYTIPWLYTTGHGDSGNGVLFASYTSDFKNIFVNGNNILCYSDTMNYIPDSLKLFDGYPEGTMFVFKNGKWEVFIESNVPLEEKVDSVETKLSGKANTTHYHTTSNITSGTLSVIRGGTGKGSWSSNRIIYPSGSTTLTQLAFPSEESVLAQKSSGSPYWKKLSELGGASLMGEGGFKKIGFTADCDYVANSSDGYTAFNNAISDANDGDTIYVMPGTYTSDNTLYITKNLNFVGVKMPILNFPIEIPCTSTFDDTNYSFIYGDSYKVGFQGIRFLKKFVVGIVTGPGECDASEVICDGCHFTVPSMAISGVFYNCFFDAETYIKTGSYYGKTSTFYNCDVSCGYFDEADVYAYGSIIRLKGGNYSTFGGGGSYSNCDIYINASGLDDNCAHMWIEFNKCRFYGYELGRYTGTYSECYTVSETVM